MDWRCIVDADGSCCFLCIEWHLDGASTYRKLKTQTSVMNGTLAAENIDVDKVCDAGGVLDNDDPTPSYSRSRAR